MAVHVRSHDQNAVIISTSDNACIAGVHKWLHEPQGAENQPVMWISPDDILKHQVTDACHNMHLAVCQAVDAHCKLETAINT